MKFNRRPIAKAVSAQKGVSVVSVLLGLVIGAGVLSVTFNQFTDSKRKARVESAASEIATMLSDAQKIYGTANQYGSVTTEVAIRGGVVPARLRITGTTPTARNQYNGLITFAPATLTSTNDSLTMTYANVASIDCQDLILSLERLTRRVSIGTTFPKPADGALNLATTATSCDTTSGVVDIGFTVGRS